MTFSLPSTSCLLKLPNIFMDTKYHEILLVLCGKEFESNKQPKFHRILMTKVVGKNADISQL